MKKSRSPNFDYDEKRMKNIEKGKNKVDKHKKKLYNMASSLKSLEDADAAFDEFMVIEQEIWDRFKSR
jgi:hypothetical protein